MRSDDAFADHQNLGRPCFCDALCCARRSWVGRVSCFGMSLDKVYSLSLVDRVCAMWFA